MQIVMVLDYDYRGESGSKMRMRDIDFLPPIGATFWFNGFAAEVASVHWYEKTKMYYVCYDVCAGDFDGEKDFVFGVEWLDETSQDWQDLISDIESERGASHE